MGLGTLLLLIDLMVIKECVWGICYAYL